ncbi:MAG: hypothetical protein AAFZ07_05630 [Actinomycetota bacterium]
MARPRRSSSAYSHRQTSLWPLAVIGVPALLGVIATSIVVVTDDDSGASLTTPFVVVLLVAVVRAAFATLETEVAAGELRARFRPLGPTKTIPIDAVTTHEQVRLPWYAGYGGLEWMSLRRAVLWSSSGRNAVEVRHRDRRGRDKRTYIGTDDAAGLSAALTAATPRSRAHR